MRQAWLPRRRSAPLGRRCAPAVYYNNTDVRLEERPVPPVGPGEMLVRIEASGICGSDVLEWYRVPKAPIVLGHEVAGTWSRSARA